MVNSRHGPRFVLNRGHVARAWLGLAFVLRCCRMTETRQTKLQIGSFQFDIPFAQAALSGYSDVPMRRLARRYGAAYTLNEVMLDKLVNQPGRLREKILRVPSDDHPVGGQLMGAGPEGFAPAAVAMAQPFPAF